MLLKRAFKPAHKENRMNDEGNVGKAREFFLNTKTDNLRFLLGRRFGWMNQYIAGNDEGIEVGAGMGASKHYINCGRFKTTDFRDDPWLDVKNVDALGTPFADESFDFVISSNMIHHLSNPMAFLREMHRILKPSGRLLIQEVSNSLVMRMLLRLMKHEGYSYDVDVFDESKPCTDPEDLWAANCAIPDMLFDDRAGFEKNVGFFEMARNERSEFLLFLNSGGVVAKTFFVPLPMPLLKLTGMVDGILTGAFPGIFALQKQIVLHKR